MLDYYNFTHELPRLAMVFYLDDGIPGLRDDLEREVLYVQLDFRIVVLAADETLGTEDCIVGIHGDLILRNITDETPIVGKGDIRGCYSVALIVGDDF